MMAGLALLAALVPLLLGCLHLREPLERPNGLDLPPLVSPGLGRGLPGTASPLWGLGAGALVLGGVGYGLRRWRRAWRQAGQGVPLDREDLALLRTAWDALGFLANKKMSGLKVVSLALHRQRSSASTGIPGRERP
ncbi:MAG: hypothetical protein HY794_07815 [Desulfarculus sp.]|nr:hypothetical protein [Desulfarculus sp.]